MKKLSMSLMLIVLTCSVIGCSSTPHKNVSDPSHGKGGFIDADGGE